MMILYLCDVILLQLENSMVHCASTTKVAEWTDRVWWLPIRKRAKNNLVITWHG